MNVLLGFPFTPSITVIKRKQCGIVEVLGNRSPSDSGGGPITGFEAQIRKRNSLNWNNCTYDLSNVNYSCSINGSLSKNTYDIRVRAVNQKGPSHWANRTFTAGRVGK